MDLSQRNMTQTARLVAAVLGFSGALGWQSTIADSLYAYSSDVSVSPFFIFFLSTALAAAALLAAPVRARAAAATPVRRRGWFAGAVVVGTAAAVAVAAQVLPLWCVYLFAMAMGLTSAACAFLWAQVLGELSEQRLVLAAFLALALASLCSLGLMSIDSPWGARVAAVLFGCLSLAGYLASVLGGRDEKDAPAEAAAPIRTAGGLAAIKPYLRIAAAVALFAAALGVTAGTTAGMASTTGIADINIDVSFATMAIAAVAVALLALLRRRLTFLVIIQIYAPVVVLTMLLNVVALEWASVWLAITIASWDVLWAIVLGLALDVARRGLLELELIFPTWWSALNGGYALGILVGQTALGYTTDQQSLYTVIACVIMGVVCSIVLLLGANPLNDKRTGATGAEDPSPAQEETPPVAAPEPEPAAEPAPEPSAEAVFEAIARANGLSAREAEIMVLLVRGHTKASIAGKLFISENTVRAHVKGIYSKLDVHSKQQLVDYVESFDVSQLR